MKETGNRSAFHTGHPKIARSDQGQISLVGNAK
jgi:hypothetical protein